MNNPDQTNTANSANAEFTVAGCTVKPAENTLLRDEETIHLEPKTMALLKLFAEQMGEVLSRQQIDESVWQIRSGMDIRPSKPLPVLLANASKDDRERLQRNESFVLNLARLASITVLDSRADAPESATSLVGEMKRLVPMAGLIDKEAELARLTKLIDKLKDNHERTEKKLQKPAFVDKAPEAVVAKERGKLAEMLNSMEQLQNQLEKIARL